MRGTARTPSRGRWQCGAPPTPFLRDGRSGWLGSGGSTLLGLEAVAEVVLSHEEAALSRGGSGRDDDVGSVHSKSGLVVRQANDLASVKTLVVAESVVEGGLRGSESRPDQVVVSDPTALIDTLKGRVCQLRCARPIILTARSNNGGGSDETDGQPYYPAHGDWTFAHCECSHMSPTSGEEVGRGEWRARARLLVPSQPEHPESARDLSARERSATTASSGVAREMPLCRDFRSQQLVTIGVWTTISLQKHAFCALASMAASTVRCLLVEEALDLRIADRLVVLQGADIGRHEGLDAVAEATGGFAEWHAAAEPGGRCGVPAVVDA